jgi:hypothetical protein
MVTANLATHKARSGVLQQVIDTLVNQVDLVRVYANDYKPKVKGAEVVTGEDLTDRGKFYFVDDSIYFSCDDDILYPTDYVQRTLEKLEKYPNAIITYHGRILLGKGRNYYFGHKSFHCLRSLHYDTFIDVAGSGVSCFNGKLWKPDVLQYPDQKMSDLLFSLEAARAGKKIICASHQMGWLQIAVDDESIYHSESKSPFVQNAYADLIYEDRYEIGIA